MQVGSYPVLRVTRTPDWGWKLANQFVYLLSDNPLAFGGGERLDRVGADGVGD